MAFSGRVLSAISSINLTWKHSPNIRSIKYPNVLHLPRQHRCPRKHSIIFSETPPWDQSPSAYSPTNDSYTGTLEETPNIFETLSSERTAETLDIKRAPTSKHQPILQEMFLKWPMWLLGPALLLATGMVPTLWLPLSSVFIGANIASLLSLVGLDCIFNLGTTLFLLMADSNARSKDLNEPYRSEAPFSYQFWNLVAAVTGFITPLLMLFGSQKGSVFFLQPQMGFISFAVLLGPYLLLLSVQVLTEMLTWHWQSPVWLVTPVVYEAYRVLQLMRALKLGVEISAPAWILHTIRGLVCWWVFILGVQLMRVAWFAGFSARKGEQQPNTING